MSSKRIWDISGTFEVIRDNVRKFVPINATVTLDLSVTPYSWLQNAANMMNGSVVHSKCVDVTETKPAPCTYKVAALPAPTPIAAWHEGLGLQPWTSTLPKSVAMEDSSDKASS